MLKKILNSPILMTWARDFVRIGSPLFVVPLVLVFYSDEEQIFYFWIPMLISMAVLTDAGISSVLMRATSYFHAGAEQIPKGRKEFDEALAFENKEPNKEGIIELFQTSRWIYLLVSALTVILMLTGGVFAFKNFITKAEDTLNLWMAFGSMVVYLAIFMINMRWNSFIRGLDFVAEVARFTTIVTAVRIIFWIALLSLKFKPLALTLVLLGEVITLHFYYRTFLLKWFKKNNIHILKAGRFNKQLFMTIWPAAWRMGGIQLGNYLVERGNNILILQIQDIAMMANFTFTTWILKTISTFSLTPVYARLPVLFKFAAEKKFNSLRKAAGSYMFVGLSMITLTYLVLGLFGNPLLESLNVDRRLIYPLAIFAVMALTEILDIHSSFHAGVYTSTNHIPFFWPTIISGAIIFFAGLYYSLPEYGLIGIILTRFFVQLSFNNWFAMYLNLRFLKWPLHKFIIDVPKYGFRYLYDKAFEFLPNKNK
ncbi:MAG: hypothetical protein JW894_08360 [Bacteroidales bacterium]|nr:hypothetical protein [Bacteroidales bacterium]